MRIRDNKERPEPLISPARSNYTLTSAASHMRRKNSKAARILGAENVVKKYLVQTSPLSYTNMSLVSSPSQSKGRKEAGLAEIITY